MARFNLLQNPGEEMPDCEYVLEIFRDTDGAFVGSMYMKDKAQADLVMARINGAKLPGQGGKLASLQRGFQVLAKGFKKSQEVAQKINKSYDFDAALGAGKGGTRIGIPGASSQHAAAPAARAADTFDTSIVSARAQGKGAPSPSSSVFGVTPRFGIDSSFSPRFKFDSGVDMMRRTGAATAGKRTAESHDSQ